MVAERVLWRQVLCDTQEAIMDRKRSAIINAETLECASIAKRAKVTAASAASPSSKKKGMTSVASSTKVSQHCAAAPLLPLMSLFVLTQPPFVTDGGGAKTGVAAASIEQVIMC